MMNSLLHKISFSVVLILSMTAIPLHAQQKSNNEKNEPFIEKGTFLTGFSFGFSSGAPTNDEDAFVNKFKNLGLQVEALYFLTDRIGVGPILGYTYFHREKPSNISKGFSEFRTWHYKLGAKTGWYMPTKKLFGGTGRSQVFLAAGISWLHNNGTDYEFGYQIGMGFLFPVGKQIAIVTKLSFQARRRELALRREARDGPIKWRKRFTLGVGLSVTF